jgi:predicted transcriptional regulator
MVMKRIVTYILMAMILVSTVIGGVQNNEQPLSKDRLLNNLLSAKHSNLTAAEYKDYIDKLIKILKTRGVDFKMKPGDEKLFRSAGATDLILAVVSANYRASWKEDKGRNDKNTRTSPPPPPPPPTPVFSPPLEGNPITFDEVIKWLRLKASETSVIVAVYQRKVDFILDSSLQRMLFEEGGTKYLFEAIEKSPSNSLMEKMSVDLSERVEKLINQMQYSEAESLLEKSLKYDDKNRNAYRLRAELSIYKNLPTGAAITDMNRALELGGEASIKVLYDCGGSTICPGKMFIGKGRVRFQPDSGSSWDLDGATIKEVKAGGRRYSKDNGGLIIITKKMPMKESLTYNFQAYRSSNEIRNLIVSLIINNL